MAPAHRFSGISYLFCAFLALIALSGCAHYRLGTESELAFHTLYIAPVKNESNLPQAVGPVSTQIREAFIQDGRVSLVNSADEADAVLQITLTEYARDKQTSLTSDTGLARKFELQLAAKGTLTLNASNKALFTDRVYTVTRQAYTDSGQLQAEYQAVPHLADELAARISSSVLDTW